MIGVSLSKWTMSYFGVALLALLGSELLMVVGFGFPSSLRLRLAHWPRSRQAIQDRRVSYVARMLRRPARQASDATRAGSRQRAARDAVVSNLLRKRRHGRDSRVPDSFACLSDRRIRDARRNDRNMRSTRVDPHAEISADTAIARRKASKVATASSQPTITKMRR